MEEKIVVRSRKVPTQSSNYLDEFRKTGLTVKELKEALGVSEREILKYLKGDARPSDEVVNKVNEITNKNRDADSKKEFLSAPKFRFVDIFAGIGGLRIGFESIGGHCVFTSEWDRWSNDTYIKNFKDGADHRLVGDIRPYGADPSKIPEFDVLLAGFPCQPFSLAGVSKKKSLGRPHGFADKKQGNLFFELRDILEHHKPPVFLLENVKNLERHDKKRTFKIITETLRKSLGYKIVDHRIISSEPWVPQKRERIFIAGFLEDVGFSFKDFDSQIPPKEMWPKLKDILEPEQNVEKKYTLTPSLWEYLQKYRAKHRAAGNGFGFGLFDEDDVARTLSARYYKDGSEILIRQTGSDVPRRLTPRECARLMGFEHGERLWNIPVSDVQSYRQFGNAVVVPVIEAIARSMAPSIEKILQKN